MTKEELEKEAEEIANRKLCSERICYNHCNFNSPKHHRCGEWHRCYESAKECAEPRERQIQALGERCLQLQKDKGNLTDRVKELEAQIEKMKCCANCMWEPPFDKHCDKCIQGVIKLKYRNWKLRR